MRLSALRAELRGTIEDGWLSFDCPHPGCRHRVRVAISSAPFHARSYRREEVSNGNPAEYDALFGRVKVWQASGTFPDALTIQPSIDLIEADEQGNKIRTICWHGFVTNGEVT